MAHKSVQEMWDRFISEYPKFSDKKYVSWYFCNTKKCADELAELVKANIKTATCSLKYWYETAGEKMPRTGEFNVITNWDGVAQCITRTLKLTEIVFRDMTEDLASREGEGDKSLAYWRRVHIKFFSDELREKGIEFNEDMPVIFEEFEKVFE
ncbi:MAG TPA: ASCH domain-containing protein [Ignavibacteria bacterium]|nr:RNA-binding protein [Bacteroidota bacterium]HRI85392.1 ASCH domain-containing protein [Ignavibacteria bacterium]HRJ99732.1 ASCH domain-containing protein [Ignavibacteria bacterium]